MCICEGRECNGAGIRCDEAMRFRRGGWLIIPTLHVAACTRKTRLAIRKGIVEEEVAGIRKKGERVGDGLTDLTKHTFNSREQPATSSSNADGATSSGRSSACDYGTHE